MKNLMKKNKIFIKAIFIATLALLNIKPTNAMNQTAYFDIVSDDVLIEIIHQGLLTTENPYDFIKNISSTCHRFYDLIHNQCNPTPNTPDQPNLYQGPNNAIIKNYLYNLAHIYVKNYDSDFLNSLPDSYFKRVSLNVEYFLKYNRFLENVDTWNIENREKIEQKLIKRNQQHIEKLNLAEINLNDDFLELVLEIIHRTQNALLLNEMFICKNPNLTTIPEIINRFRNIEVLMMHTNPNLVNVPQDFGLHFPQMRKFNIDETGLNALEKHQISDRIDQAIKALRNFRLTIKKEEIKRKTLLQRSLTHPILQTTPYPRSRPLGKSKTFCIKRY